MRRGLVWGLCCVAAYRADAQEGIPASRDTTAAHRPVSVITLAPIALRAEAGSLLTVRVPLPPALRGPNGRPGATRVAAITSGPQVRVQSPTPVVLVAQDSVVRVLLSLSRTLLAGRHQAATIRLAETHADGQTAHWIQPVQVDIPAQQQLTLQADDQPVPARRGQWTTVTIAVINRGNAEDTAVVQLTIPSGWRVRERAVMPPLHLAPGETRVLTRSLWIPADALVGQYLVPLSLARRLPASAPRVGRWTLRLHVTDGTPAQRAGPRLTLSAVAAHAPDGTVAQAYGGAISGALSDSVRIDGRVTLAPAAPGGAAYGLARTGVSASPPALALEAPRLGVSLGTVMGGTEELTTLNTAGFGVAARARTGGTAVRLLAARPLALTPGRGWAAATGRMVGVGVDRLVGTDAVPIDLHLDLIQARDAEGARALDAVGVAVHRGFNAGGEATGALGYRRYAGGSGLGLSTTIRRTIGRTNLDLRLVQAPGGSRAFARAAQELSVAATQRVGDHLTVAGGTWRQRDDALGLGRYLNTGWYITPTWALRSWGTTVSLEGRGGTFRSDAALGTFRNQESQVGMAIDTRRGVAVFGWRASRGLITRRVTFDSTPTLPERGQRAEMRATAGLLLSRMHLEAAWQVQQFAGTSALGPMHQSVQLRVDQLTLLTGPWRTTAFADAQRMQTGATGVALWFARAGLVVRGPAGIELTLQAERAPFLAMQGSRGTPVLYTVRVDHVSNLPAVAVRSTGTVFLDADGNGRRDPGERGVAGVVITCAGVQTVSDAAGRVSCPAGDAVQVDPRSVPLGLLAPTASPRVRATASGVVVPLRPVLVQRVALALVEPDTMRVRPEDLSRAIVMARAADGTVWTARPDAEPGAFLFDALPPGRYRLEIDVRELAEPLVPVAPLPDFAVEATPTAALPARTEAPALRVSFRPRRIKRTVLDDGARAPSSPSELPTAVLRLSSP